MKLLIATLFLITSFSVFAEDFYLECGVGRGNNSNWKYYTKSPIKAGKGMLVITRGIYTYVLSVKNKKYHAFKTDSVSGGYVEERDINITAYIYGHEANMIDDVWCYIPGLVKP